MDCDVLNTYVVEEALELSPEFVRENAHLIPLLFQASLLNELDVRVERVPDLFLQYIERITPFDTALLYVWEPEEMWYCRGLQGRIPDAVERGNLFTLCMRETAKPVLIPELSACGLDRTGLPVDFSSMLGVPILIDTNTVGCVELYRKQGTAFSLNDVNLIKQLLLYSEKVLRDTFVPDRNFDEALDVRTDVPLRYVLLDILHQYEEQAKRLAYPLSVALIEIQDIARLGFCEDIPGLIRTLQMASKGIGDGLRCYDKVLRYEEKSFFAILPGCSSLEALAALDHALCGLNDDLGLNLAVGIATLPNEAQDAKSLINASRQALSHAVKAGLKMATFSQTHSVLPVNLSMELEVIRLLKGPPSVGRLNALLELLRVQCQAGRIAINSDGEGRPASWEGRELGYLSGGGLGEEVLAWVMTGLGPAWAVALHLNDDLRDWYLGILLTASILADLRAGYPMGYSLRVADDLYAFARSLGVEDQRALGWSHTALAANIGYLGIPGAVFTKEEINPFDRSKIQQHPIISARMLRDAALVHFDTDVLVYHHENMDGSGYPRGLTGGDIPEGARVLRVVDTYNALISPRLYRTCLPPEEALQVLAGLTPGTLDTDLTVRFRGFIGS